MFLDLVAEMSRKGDLTFKDIQDEINTFIPAGYDSTSTTVGWCLYTLGHHPDAQDKVVVELEERVPNFGSEPLTLKDISSLEYLECCIKEAQRLYPPVPFYGRHISQPLDIGKERKESKKLEFINFGDGSSGKMIPAGTSVIVDTYTLHRDPQQFSNPNEFIPERFLPGNAADIHPFAYLPFSAGPRNCIGQRLATINSKVMLASILKAYKIRSVDPVDKLTLSAEIVLTNHTGINIIIEKRNTS